MQQQGINSHLSGPYKHHPMHQNLPPHLHHQMPLHPITGMELPPPQQINPNFNRTNPQMNIPQAQAPPPSVAETTGGWFNLKSRRFAVTALGNPRINIYRSGLQKSVENYLFDHQKNILMAAGPRRSPLGSGGFVCAYPASSTLLAVADSPELADEYLMWIRKRVRGLGVPDTLDGSDQRLMNCAIMYEVPAENEIRVVELYYFLKHHFPHWLVTYSPDVSAFLAIRRPAEPTQHQCLLALPPQIRQSLTPLQKGVYDLLSKEASEDLQATQVMMRMGPVQQSASDVFHMLHRTGRKATILIDAQNVIVHNLNVGFEQFFIIVEIPMFQDERETQALTQQFLLPILAHFIAPMNSPEIPSLNIIIP